MDRNYYCVVERKENKCTYAWEKAEKEYSLFHILMIYAAIVAGGVAPIMIISEIFLYGFEEAFRENGVVFAIVFAELHLVLSLLVKHIGKLSGRRKQKNREDLRAFLKEHPNIVIVSVAAFVAGFFAMLTSDINIFFTFLFFIYGLYMIIRIAVISCKE